ncbi:hypothetical protein DOY81_009911 [Sarcophaga bullata]|nr:hypothetical protein DOY81_009911 [Sarcophaga bullata]
MAQTPNYNLPANAPPTIFNVTPTGPAQVFPQPVGPKSMQMTCPHCRCRIETNVRYKATAKTHIACLLLSWTFCCCCLPYCMDSCQNANHFCPMCGAYIGTYAS